MYTMSCAGIRIQILPLVFLEQAGGGGGGVVPGVSHLLPVYKVAMPSPQALLLRYVTALHHTALLHHSVCVLSFGLCTCFAC